MKSILDQLKDKIGAKAISPGPHAKRQIECELMIHGLIEIVEEQSAVLNELAEEQKSYVPKKDYFSEVVRLNLTAEDALIATESKLKALLEGK